MVSSSTKKVVGADEVFPLIVYAVLKGNIRKLKSNLSFIELFRHKTRLESEEEYYVTTLTSVVQFVENITSKAIRMDELNFNNLINKEKKRINIDKDKEISNIFLKSKNFIIITKYFNKKKIMMKTTYCITLIIIKMKKIQIMLN